MAGEGKSKFHLHIRRLLRTSSLFSTHKVFEEYPVYKVDTSFSNRRCHYDFVIPSMRVVIEVHGQQHYRPITRSSKTFAEEAMAEYERRRHLDLTKQRAAESTGFIYIEICYSDIEDGVVDASWLLEKIRESKDVK